MKVNILKKNNIQSEALLADLPTDIMSVGTEAVLT
jgi:hypothetical protein